MPKFLFRVSLNAEGVAGVLAEGGTARREVVKDAIESVGGTLEAFYFAFGADDVVAIVDVPDQETAAGLAMQFSSSDRMAVTTTVLLTPEQVDRARETKSSWRPPGG
jgi:uncharacterized protein with GYD domain